MKKLILLVFAVVFIVVLTACGTGDNFFTGERHGTPEGYTVVEWVSPDGVHYWKYGLYGLSPRYDNNGNLVIEKTDDFKP